MVGGAGDDAGAVSGGVESVGTSSLHAQYHTLRPLGQWSIQTFIKASHQFYQQYWCRDKTIDQHTILFNQ